jgi:hypothetical protein
VTHEQKLNALRARREKLLTEMQTSPHPQVLALIERELARVNEEIARLVR